MFDIAPTELMLVGMVALLVIGPKDLPKAMRFVGYWVSRARGVARQFRSGFDSMMREAELQEMEKKWAEENERIMREHPPTAQQMLPMAPLVEPHGETGIDAGAPDYVDHEDAPAVTVEPPVVAAKPRAPRKSRPKVTATDPASDEATS